ncbi:MAG: hypothetical protein QOJ16_1890 [Acidobacteriota bacterium]|nr:hypothetical protein [Acidobacteriota bacterium]
MLAFDRGLGGDGWASFAALESLVDDGDLHLENNLRGVRNGIVPTPSGHLVMQYPPGILLLDLPPFLAGRAADALLPAAWLARGADLPPVGRVPRRVFLSGAAIVLARNVATLLGLFWLALALRRLGFAEGTVAAAVAFTFFGGPLLFYSLVGMTHAPSFALASLLFLLLVRYWERVGEGVDSRLSPPGGSLPPGRGRVGSGGRPGGGRLACAAGLVLGLAVLVRYGAVGLLPAAVLAVAGRSGRPRLLRLLVFGAGFTLPLLLLPLYWHAVSGGWGSPGYGGVWRLTLGSPWNVLFSPHHGLFLFHPALLLAALGLAWATCEELRRRAPGMGTVALLGFLGIAVLHGWWSEWANPGGYGQRFLTDALPALGLGFARILAARPARLWKTAGIAATIFGYILFFTAIAGLVPPPPPYPWPQRLADYRTLLTAPPGPVEIWEGLKRASLPLRAVSDGFSRPPKPL